MTLTIIIITLILSAFFSGMEIAYISSNRLRIEIDRKQSRTYNHIAAIFLRHPGQYISTMLVGNNVMLVVYSLFMSQIICTYITDNIIVETIISTIIIIIAAEFIPKGIVKTSPNKYLRVLSLPAYLFYLLFYPIARFTSQLAVWILRLFGMKAKSDIQITTFGKIDLQTLVEETNPNNTAGNDSENDKELQILQNALDFSEIKVRECMVPRVEMMACDIEATPEELLDIFRRTHYSRIPLYEGSIDNIVGYANSREMFRHPKTVAHMKLEIIYVPESAPVQRLLSEFIHRRKSMAIVIDEFGSTAGIITIEDILEQIVGEIEDEHDQEYMVQREIAPKKWLFSARQEISYLNTQYNLQIPESEEYETLAGYILYNSEDLPQTGDTFHLNNLSFKIIRASSNKISLIEITQK